MSQSSKVKKPATSVSIYAPMHIISFVVSCTAVCILRHYRRLLDHYALSNSQLNSEEIIALFVDVLNRTKCTVSSL